MRGSWPDLPTDWGPLLLRRTVRVATAIGAIREGRARKLICAGRTGKLACVLEYASFPFNRASISKGA
jgi:hypothetical protein